MDSLNTLIMNYLDSLPEWFWHMVLAGAFIAAFALAALCEHEERSK